MKTGNNYIMLASEIVCNIMYLPIEYCIQKGEKKVANF